MKPYFFLLISSFYHYVFCFVIPLPRSALFHSNSKSSIYSTNWADQDGSDMNNFDTNSLPTLSAAMEITLDHDLGLLVTTCSLNTISYYMLEFHDDVTQRWMIQFSNYSSNGFKEGKWENYLEEMIKTNRQTMIVTMRDPMSDMQMRGRRRSKDVPEIPEDPRNKNAVSYKVQYSHEIEPRKIAHQILTVREDVSNEIIRDLGSIKIENHEAVKYARNRISNGKEYAEKYRNVCRMGSQDGSTPLREKNFKDISVIITNYALEIVKAKLNKYHDTVSIECLNESLTRVMKEIEVNDPVERAMREKLAPRTLIEELCFVGMKDGTSATAGSSSSSYLRLANEIMSARLAVALQMVRSLEAQSLDARRYYKTIKDFGGFNKFDYQKPKLEIIHLDSDGNPIKTTSSTNSGDIAEEQKKKITNESSKEQSTPVAEESVKQELKSEEKVTPKNIIPIVKEDEESDLFTVAESGSLGPMMM
eukprot:gene4139-5893_t